MSPDLTGSCIPGADERCSICADEAIRGTVVVVNRESLTAKVLLPAGLSTVALDLVGNVAAGDELMVHLGFAIALVGRHD